MTETLVQALLESQHPDLSTLPITAAGMGFDNTLWRLGDDLLVRLPRREVAVELTRQEQRWLPQLAALLPLPIPVPIRTGRPGSGYPWPWSVVPWLEGVPGDEAQCNPVETGFVLGGFLTRLHRIAPRDAPSSEFRGCPLASRDGTVRTRMADLSGDINHAAVAQVWAQSLDAPEHHGPALWLHGDLHPANVLFDRGVPSAVIDFGDMCAGDPATDLASSWLLSPESVAGCFAAYGESGAPGLRDRTKGWAVYFALLLLALGLKGRPTYEALARRTLEALSAALSDS